MNDNKQPHPLRLANALENDAVPESIYRDSANELRRQHAEIERLMCINEVVLDVLEKINKLSVGDDAICLPAEIDTAVESLRNTFKPQPLTDEQIQSANELGKEA